MSGQRAYHVQADELLPGFDLVSCLLLRSSHGTYAVGYMSGATATPTTTTTRWHQPGALRGRGLF
jgi:hypothetical protein